MEEIKNGVISEETLDEIAGGLKISKSTVKKVLTTAGVVVGALGGGVGGYLVYDKFFKNKKPKDQVVVGQGEEKKGDGIQKIKIEGNNDPLLAKNN